MVNLVRRDDVAHRSNSLYGIEEFVCKCDRRPHPVASIREPHDSHTRNTGKNPDAMAREIPGGDGIVIELGGGTGSVTAGLLRAGIAADRLVVVEQDKLLTGAWCVTGGCGPLIQFTYGLRCPATAALLAKSGARAQRRAWIWRNVPPASVWRLEIHASAEVNSEFDHVRHTP